MVLKQLRAQSEFGQVEHHLLTGDTDHGEYLAFDRLHIEMKTAEYPVESSEVKMPQNKTSWTMCPKMMLMTIFLMISLKTLHHPVLIELFVVGELKGWTETSAVKN